MTDPYQHPPFTPSSFLDNPSFSAEIQRLSRENSALPAHLAASADQVSADVSRYEEEISRLCARVEQLKNNKASLEALRASVRSLIPSVAPVRRLPSELLVSVFQHLTTGRWWTFSPFDHVIFLDLRTLARVCFRWFRLVLDTPTLWTQIYLEASFLKPPEVVAKALATALKRSMDASLDVEVHDDRGYDRDILEEPLQVLAKSSHRWRTATFYGSEMPEDILQRVPRLERLSIRASHPSLRSHWINAVKVADVPRLRHLVLAGSFDISALPLENLQETKLDGVDSSSLTTLLLSITRIIGQLSLTVTPDSIPSLPSITSDIHRLSLRLDTDSTNFAVQAALMCELLANMTLPHLSALTLSASDYPQSVLPWTSATADAFFRCAARSNFAENLLSLDIREVGLEAAQLPGLLAALPALTELSVSDPGVDESETSIFGDELFARLSAEGSSLVPHLCKLTYVSNLSFDTLVFRDLLRSRACAQPIGVKFHLRLEWFKKRLSTRNFLAYVMGRPYQLVDVLTELEGECGGKLEVDCVEFRHPNQGSP